MTPRQRRQQLAAMESAASAPRKSWLGKFTQLSAVQSAWIKSLLTVWGECVGGKTRSEYRMENRGTFWATVKKEEWSDGQLSTITEAISQARAEGFTGQQVLRRAYSILWPVTLSDMLDDAGREDDVEFMESVVLASLKMDDPVYLIGREYYTTRKKISDLTRELQLVAPWLSAGEARKRVRWCLEIFRAKVFLAARRQLAAD